MANVILRLWFLSLTVGLVAIAALAACSGDDPAQDSGPAAAGTTTAADEAETAESPSEQRRAATTSTEDEQPESSASGSPQAAQEESAEPPAGGAPQVEAQPGSAQSTRSIDRDTTWRDVYETLTDSEQACVREQLGVEAEAMLARRVLGDELDQPWGVELFSCLSPETGRELLLSAVLVGMADEGLEVGDEATACLREVLAGIDPASVMAAAQEDGPEIDEFIGGVWRCLPELLFESIAAELGVEPDSESEACLRQLLDEADASDLVDEGSPEYERFYAELLNCLPVRSQVTGPASAANAGSDAYDGPDDHADSLDGATAIAVGVHASGELGSDYDSDYFVFEAEQGVLYEITVGLVTLGDSVLTLYDAEWRQLASSDDHADTLASRLYWLAEYTGDHYLEVWGYGRGAYTLLVEAR